MEGQNLAFAEEGFKTMLKGERFTLPEVRAYQ
jgi:hypothetical protein